jgi:hypothetical protein
MNHQLLYEVMAHAPVVDDKRRIRCPELWFPLFLAYLAKIFSFFQAKRAKRALTGIR